MRLKSIETTPNPNSMKLNLDQPVAKAVTYTREQRETCPQHVALLLDIEGVKSVFVCHDFITINRDPRADWQLILDAATQVLTGAQRTDAGVNEQRQACEKLGQVSVFVQTFRGIPIQVKVAGAQGEKRVALELRFSQAAQLAQAQTGAEFLKERYWADWGVRYGSLEEVAADVADEIEGTLGENEVEQLLARAVGQSFDAAPSRSMEQLKAALLSDDWHQRLLAVQELGTAEGAVDMLIGALGDANHQVRRLVAAALGASGNAAAVEPLAEALLNDPAVGVRRTAGDALSDLANVSAQPAVCRALRDSNKLVRWRAARFLADLGTDESLPFLREAADDPEFEVRLEIEAAIERISGGKEGSTPVWKKILDSGKNN